MSYLLIPLAVILSASAQIMLKQASGFENWTGRWFLFLILSGAIYLAALFLYMSLMRIYPISRIYPTLTVLVILVITVYGAIIGETISVRHIAGLALGGVAIFLLLS
jgi:multidrug transporter EmrE-like cation transporter